MAALSLSKFHEPDWDTKLDDMLADLETGTNKKMMSNNSFSFQQQQQQQFSYSSSQQQMVGGSVTQQQQKSFSSSARSHQAIGPKTNGSNGKGYSLQKSASSVSLKDSAGDVLKDLEDGLVKSSHYIKESHGKVCGPEGTQEWHDVQRGGDPPAQAFDLEMQVQHMMPNLVNYSTNDNQYHQHHLDQQHQEQQQLYHQQTQHNYHQQQQNYQQEQQTHRYQPQQQQQQIQQLEDADDRPGSRLKQNIDELDNLLYDLNHARTVTPEGGTEYTDTYATGLDSDDYSESVGKEGHVKRTVTAFNEYSQQMYTSPEVAKKPPSPSPRRKAPTSPSSGRRGPPAVGAQSYFSQQQQASSSNSYMSSQQQSSGSYVTQGMAGSPGEYPGGQTTYSGAPGEYPGGQTTYSPPPSLNYQTGAVPAITSAGSNNFFPDSDYPPPRSPEVGQPSYYTKFSSVKQASTVQSPQEKLGGRFPTTSARSPTPQHLPKQVDELMSEFQEFDSTISKSVSPKPMFSKAMPPVVQVTGPPTDSEPCLPGPAPVVRNPSPPKPVAPSKVKGPSVYYPPGHEFAQQYESRNKATTVVVPALNSDSTNGGHLVDGEAAGGSAMAMGSSGAAASMRVESRKERYAREEKEATQGAAMIPICLPLCCAAPCVIM